MTIKKTFNIRNKILLILCVVLSLTIVGNFVISGEIFQNAQIEAFDNEAFATARGLQTNINSLIEKSFLPYTEIINCEPLLDSFVEKNTNVLYVYTTDIEGKALYTSAKVEFPFINSEKLAYNAKCGIEECIDDKEHGKLHYILPLYQIEVTDDGNSTSNVGVLVVVYPRTCITDPLNRLYSNNAVLATITFALSLFLTFLFITQWVTQPLQKLDEAILNVSHKGLDEERMLDIKTNDEIGQIAQSFNDMISQLEATTVSKNYINSILFNMTEALYVIDSDKKIVTVNDAAVKLLGYTQDELKGQSIGLLYVKENDNPFVNEHYQNLIENNKFRNFETEFKDKNDNIIAVSVSWSSIRDDDGRVTNFVCTARDITEIKKAQSIIMYQANHDELTGLCNRYNLENSIERILNDKDKQHVYVVIDLDKFKIVNDVCGHTAGDKLLKQIAYMIKNLVGESHMVARTGGDEFAIMFYDTHIQEALKIIEELLRTVHNYNFVWDDKVFNVGMSIGAYVIDNDVPDRMKVDKSADKACYIAKRKGGNCVHVFSESDMTENGVVDEESISQVVMEAFENNRFFLVYQPIAKSGNTAEVCRFEVLVRLITKDGNVLKPGAFLTTAERYNKLCVLDKWVIHNFCMSYDEITKNVNLNKNVRFHINLTKESLNTEGFFEYICNELTTYNVPAEAICFEITENCAVSNLEDVTNFMKKLIKTGCEFAIDNFGCGMSSFMYLRLLPIDMVKIDGSFISEIGNSEVDFAVVKSINEIAHLLNIKTVASWVENEEILEKVKEIDVDYIQGYEIKEPTEIN